MDVTKLHLAYRALERCGVTWSRVPDLPSWVWGQHTTYLGSVSTAAGSLRLYEGAWSGLRVLQRLDSDGSWLVATVAISLPARGPARPSLAHRFTYPRRRSWRRAG